MKSDAFDVPSGQLIEKDVCIIGAGAAGITLARSLAETGKSILLLEGGGEAYEEASQDLNQGSLTTNALPEEFKEGYLVWSRKRQLGGGTNCWNGWCVKLDPQDFKKRSWIPHSGWPFDHTELDAYYERANPLVGITPFDYTFDKETPELGRPILPLSSRFYSHTLHRDPNVPRFGKRYKEELFSSKAIEVMLHANVTDIRLTPAKQQVDFITVRTLKGNSFKVKAGLFFLCAGGLENPRLLLSSNKDDPAGIGNHHGLVGRYFMEHIQYYNIAELFLTHPEYRIQGYMNLYFRKYFSHLGPQPYVALTLKEQTQIEEELLNVSIYLEERDSRNPLNNTTLVKRKLFEASTRLDHYPIKVPFFKPDQCYLGSLTCRSEQRPHPDSYVALDPSETDPLGVPKIKLHWQLSNEDKRSIYRSLELLAQDLGAFSEGRLRLNFDPDNPQNPSAGGPHHMGTTRMSEDPTKGVVDGQGKVHGLANLFVAGSSVFPTGGFANPTYTILALTLRMADHVKKEYL